MNRAALAFGSGLAARRTEGNRWFPSVTSFPLVACPSRRSDTLLAWLRGVSARRPITLMIGVALACVAAIAWAQTVKPVSVWSGVYTAAQNKRGEVLHTDLCAMCHGPQLNGAGQSEMPPSPAIAGATFLRKWAGGNVAALFVIVRHTMPPDGPGTLTDQQSLDAVAHMLAVSGIPAGDRELPLDPSALASIMMEVQPK